MEAMSRRYCWREKRYLLAMSWGSVLAARVAQKKVAPVDGVLVYGQVLCRLMQTEGSVWAVLQSKAPRRVKEHVREMVEAQDFSAKNNMKMSRYVRKYTEGYTNRREPKAPMGEMIKGILTSPDYRFHDFLAIVINGYMKNTSLIDELARIDLREALAGVRIPYRILQGDTDVVTDTDLMKQFSKIPYDSLSHTEFLPIYKITYRIGKRIFHTGSGTGRSIGYILSILFLWQPFSILLSLDV